MDLRGQIVERAHAVTMANELVAQVRSDEPRAAGDEYVHRSAPLRTRSPFGRAAAPAQ
jgi:hypothetical protein